MAGQSVVGEMPMRLKKWLLKRSVVLGLIILVALSLTLANILPQRGVLEGNSVNPRTVSSPELSLLIRWLGLDHIVTTVWFALLSAFFVFSLLLSTYDQFQNVRKRIRAVPPVARGDEQVLTVGIDDFLKGLRSEGYRLVAGNAGSDRFLKMTCGYWGSFLLHLGITLTVLFSLVYILTEHRVIIRVVQGDRGNIGDLIYAERRGSLPAGLSLPKSVILKKINPVFWDNDQIKSLSSELLFYDQHEMPTRISIGINDKGKYNGFTVYQRSTYGNIFLVEFSDGNGPFLMPLYLPMPKNRDSAGYGNFEVGDGRFRLKAKYFADAAKKEMISDNPLLVLRLYDGEKMLEETPLMKNGAGSLGPYTVHLVSIGWWEELLVEGSRGMGGIFLGFLVLLSGGVLGFFAVPREVLIYKGPKGYTFRWHAANFTDFYREEGERIQSYARGES